MGQFNLTTTLIPEGGVGTRFGSARCRFAILDRDGTINAERDYLSSPDQVELLPRASEGLRLLRDLGLRMIVVTNQSGVGRRYYDMAQVEETHNRLIELLAADRVELDGIYVCPHAPEDDCNCRKPRTGLLEQAAGELGFCARDGFVIGDKPSDIDLGKAVGAKTVLVRTGYGAEHEAAGTVAPDFIADDLLEAAEWIGR